MAVYKIDPLGDPRWAIFLESHPRASVFHTGPWLDALRRTYGYEPIAITTSPPEEPIRSGIAICKVKSWITGVRLVSVPFADHCDPLAHNSADLVEMLSFLQDECDRHGTGYVEIRPFSLDVPEGIRFTTSDQFWHHKVELGRSLKEQFQLLHKDCIQRSIQRAKRNSVECESGRSADLLKEFYRLLVLTRKRHGLPPQPLLWFQNLLSVFKDTAAIHVARKDGKTIAAIMTLRCKTCMVYKYGASDAATHRFGGMPLLLWEAMQQAHKCGCMEFDLGRSDTDNPGLLTFKERMGGSRMPLHYIRYASGPEKRKHWPVPAGIKARIFRQLPQRILIMAGEIAYRHVG